MDALEAPVRVPAEFVGRARQYRESVRVEDHAFDHALATIVRPLRARLMRHPRLRHEMIAGTERLYRLTVPSTFRVGEVEIVKDRAEFAIAETRITVSWLHDDEWDNDHREHGVALCRYGVSVLDGKLHERWTPLANVSLHAFARRIERGQDRSHGMLLQDLARLAVLPGGPSERVDTTDGFWLGAMIDAKVGKRPVRMRHVRTWIAV